MSDERRCRHGLTRDEYMRGVPPAPIVHDGINHYEDCEELAELDSQAAVLAEEVNHLTAQLGQLQGKDDHPEHKCDRCGGRNIIWYADSDLWNTHHGEWSILCPICFVERAEIEGFTPPSWRVAPGDYSDEHSRLLVRFHDLQESHSKLTAQLGAAQKALSAAKRAVEEVRRIVGRPIRGSNGRVQGASR